MASSAASKMAKRKVAMWAIGAILGSTVGVVVAAFMVMVVVVGAVVVLIAGGSATASTANSQVGNCSLVNIETESPGYICFVYPLTQPRQDETDYLPAPPEAQLTADIAIPVSDQSGLISSCYSSWATHTQYGGEPCGADRGYPGQCTFWALFNWNNPAMSGMTGNADQFYNNAQGLGVVPIPAGPLPPVGAIVVWDPTSGLYGSNGHVAIVVAVNTAANDYVVGEMNWLTPWVIDYRVVSNKPGGNGYGNLLGFLPASAPTTGATS